MLSKYQLKVNERSTIALIQGLGFKDYIWVMVVAPDGRVIGLPATIDKNYQVLDDSYWVWVKFKDPRTGGNIFGGRWVPVSSLVLSSEWNVREIIEVYNSDWVLGYMERNFYTKKSYQEKFNKGKET